MKAWLAYFFGQGDTVEFQLFSAAHFLPLLLLAAAIFGIYRFRDRLRSCKCENQIRLTLAFIGIICMMSYYWRLVGMPSLGPNPQENLPITVCEWAVIFCSLLVLSNNQTLFDIAYFWLLAGTTFALLTPTVITYCGPTRFRYYQFWVGHTIGYVMLFYMIFVHGMRPTVKSAVKSWCLLVVLSVIAYCANAMLGPGANYLFMARPEATPSVLDILPPNFALRTAIMAAVITALFALAYLPWYVRDRKAQTVTCS